MHKIVETVGISKDRVGYILHEIWGMKKLSARWVPRLLIPDNKRNRENTSKQCLKLFKRNPKEFLRPFVSVDETWIHWYTLKTKEQSKTVDFTRRTCTEVGEDCPIGQKGDGHRFLGFTRCDLHQQP